MIYEYAFGAVIDLWLIHADVAASAMTDKRIDFCNWDEAAAVLAVVFVAELSAADKAVLDAIVAVYA